MDARKSLYPDETPTQAAIAELVSAQSALNMEPHPLPEPTGPYIADKDAWVRHAYDHIHAAIGILSGRIK